MKTIFVSGTFNIVHPGHQRLLRFAKSLGRKLIVGVLSDKIINDKSYINEDLRLEGVQSLSYVDHAKIIKSSLSETIKEIKPDIIVKGKEFEKKFNIEKDLLKKYKGKIIFSSGDISFSSSDILNKEFNNLNNGKINLPEEYINRHKIKTHNLIQTVNKFSKLKVCVIGDLILDEYIMCDPIGMSQEDPTLVVTPTESKMFVGGAGIVAAHCAALGAKTNFISIVGKDKLSKIGENMLKEKGVYAKLIPDVSRQTTLKQRFKKFNHSLLKVSHFQNHSITIELQNELVKKFEAIAKNLDVLIFSDFNYGVLPKEVIKNIIKICRTNKIFISADSQSSSQLGDIGKYKGAHLVTPTEYEARLFTRNTEDGLVILSESITNQIKCKNILLKLGREGIFIHNGKKAKSKFITDRISALNKFPQDVAGAGDSLLAVATLALFLGSTIWEAGLLGSIAASVQVSRLGNVPIRSKEILSILK